MYKRVVERQPPPSFQGTHTGSRMQTEEFDDMRPERERGDLVAAKHKPATQSEQESTDTVRHRRLTYSRFTKNDSSKQTRSSSSSSSPPPPVGVSSLSIPASAAGDLAAAAARAWKKTQLVLIGVSIRIITGFGSRPVIWISGTENPIGDPSLSDHQETVPLTA